MRHLLREVRYATRTLVKNPGFTIVVLLTMALGIGANSAIFTIMNGVLLRPLAYKEADRLVIISNNFGKEGQDQKLMSIVEFEDIQRQSKSFEQITGWLPLPVNLTGVDRPQRISAIESTLNYFSVLGVEPALGRTFQPEDYQTGMSPVAVISHQLWQNNFGADPNVLGRSLLLDYDSYQIVGVMPTGFRAPGTLPGADVDVWLAAGFKTAPFPTPARKDRHLNLIARMKTGVDLGAAKSEIKLLAGQIQQEHADHYSSRWTIEVGALQDSIVGDAGRGLLILMGAVFLVLLIACTNVAGLMLVRATHRQKEMAIRTALGATPIRLVRQLLFESALLSLVSAGLGYLLAVFALKILFILSPPNLPRINEIRPDSTVALFTLGLSVLTGIALGVFPAFETAKTDVVNMIKEGAGAATAGVRHHRLRRIFVVSQFALASVLLVGAGLLMKSFWRAHSVDPGFNPDNLMIIGLWLPYPNQPETGKYFQRDKRAAFFDQILQRVEALPGVKAAGMTSILPIDRDKSDKPIFIDGREYLGPQDLAHATHSSVSYNYFNSMGISLSKGRFFTQYDNDNSAPVAIINETMAQRYWQNGDAIGRNVKFRANGRLLEIVGIVRNVKSNGLDTDIPAELYTPYLQSPPLSMTLAVRTETDPAGLAQAVQREISAVDVDQPIYNVKLMNDILSVSIQQRRFSALLLSIFAAAALILAAIGIYGVMAYSMVQRRQEFAIRAAMGANQSQLLKMVLAQAMLMSLAGVGTGLVVALVFSRTLTSMLFDVSSSDPLIFLTAPAVLAFVAFLGSYIPARKVVRVDPARALKYG